jgi:hypothetical protein
MCFRQGLAARWWVGRALRGLLASTVGEKLLPRVLLTIVASVCTTATVILYRSLALIMVWLTGVTSGFLLPGLFVFPPILDEVFYRPASG